VNIFHKLIDRCVYFAWLAFCLAAFVLSGGNASWLADE
jgi:hypothetical protein